MKTTRCLLFVITLLFALALLGCNPRPQLEALTPIPTLAPGTEVTLVPAVAGERGEGSGTMAASDVTPSEQAAAAGAHFFQANCTTCHGIQGEGVDAPPLRNSQYVQMNGDEAIFGVIAAGREGTEMPGWLQNNGGPLTAGEIADIIGYLHTLQGVPEVPPSPMEEEEGHEHEAEAEPNAPPARPSNPGEAGPAASLTGDAERGQPLFGVACAPCHGPQGVQGIPNPGSEDASVPVLNPIDPTIASDDPALFAENVDLFVEHGSIPEGEYPRLLMPAFGDHDLLGDQQIADVIAYIIAMQEEPSEEGSH